IFNAKNIYIFSLKFNMLPPKPAALARGNGINGRCRRGKTSRAITWTISPRLSIDHLTALCSHWRQPDDLDQV
ncbi:MAG: hypothetical protein FWG62_00530, partial [Proteobacteria bacterium]|nr:hypothetical protein [Pseudomonadota bacterium]